MITSTLFLKDYVDIPQDMKQFADRMTMTGTICENYEYRGGKISNIVAARVDSIERHPDSDHMWVCKVFDGQKVHNVVTGAQNVKQGDIVPLARDNSYLAAGKHITTGELRGVLSEGMLCSASELGITSGIAPKYAEDGIYILAKDVPLGEDILKVLGLDENIVEFELTNNRQDCNSVLGMACEISASYGKRFAFPDYEYDSPKNDIEKYLGIEVERFDLCRRYTARMVKVLKIEPSPMWIQIRLMSCGVRPINNIVDVSNYVMIETGQPLHTFDYDKLEGRKIRVKTAKEGDSLKTLDGVERPLQDNTLMICDGNKYVCIAGVMGGENSDITDDTRYVVIESANFNKSSVRNTSKRLGLRTESSSRFEKGLSIFLTKYAADRAASLLVEIGACEYVDGVIDIYEALDEVPEITMDMDWYNKFIGINISAEQAVQYLDLLGFDGKVEGNYIRVTSPKFRQDIEIKEDVAEEVTRMFGYDNIPQTRIESSSYISPINDYYAGKLKIKELLKGIGGCDMLTYSFDSPAHLKAFGFAEDDIRSQPETLINPLGEDTSIMRTTILTGVMNAIKLNYNKKNKPELMFEIACAFLKNEDSGELPHNIDRLSIGKFDSDFYEIKAVVEYLLNSLKLGEAKYIAANEPFLHPGRSAYVILGNVNIGYIGQVHPLFAKAYEVPESVCIAELEVEEIVKKASAVEIKMKNLAKYPAVERDLALVMEEGLQAGSVKQTILENGGEYIISCEVFDVYRSEALGEGMKSIAYSIVFRSDEGTLTDDVTEKAMSNIIRSLKDMYNISVRE